MEYLQDLRAGKAFLNMAEKALIIKKNECNYINMKTFY